MKKALKYLLLFLVFGLIIWFVFSKINTPKNITQTRHDFLLESIETIGKLELVKYRFSDVVEHKNITSYLPDASVLLIVKADAVGCIDLTKIKSEDIKVVGDSVSIVLPAPEICYVKIDHDASRVYDTKMAFFREATLVDEAFKNAEKEVIREVKKSDIMSQTRNSAINVMRPLLNGLGFEKVSISFDN